MTVSKSQQKAVHKYVKANYDRIELTVPKGEKDTIKAHAAARSESVNGFINRAIKNQIKRDSDAPGATDGLVSARTSGEYIIAQDTLKRAQEAAQAAGETTPQFIDRAVETQAQRDKLTQKMLGRTSEKPAEE